MLRWTLLTLTLVALGCTPKAPPTPKTKATESKKSQSPEQLAFESKLKTGQNHEAREAAVKYFVVNSSADKYGDSLKKANEVKNEKSRSIHKFWLRGKNPSIEGDGWVEVVVSKDAKPVIESVRTVILKK